MWGLIKRVVAGRAHKLDQIDVDPVEALDAEIERGIARARARRLARPQHNERKRFQLARPKVDQLAREMMTAPVLF